MATFESYWKAQDGILRNGMFHDILTDPRPFGPSGMISRKDHRRKGPNDKIGIVRMDIRCHYSEYARDSVTVDGRRRGEGRHYFKVMLEGYIPSRFISYDRQETTKPGTVRGRITLDGEPVADLQVAVTNQGSLIARDDEEFWKRTKTKSDGRFLLKKVPPGPQKLVWRWKGSSKQAGIVQFDLWTGKRFGGDRILRPGGQLDYGTVEIPPKDEN